jgi:phage gp46-like protein
VSDPFGIDLELLVNRERQHSRDRGVDLSTVVRPESAAVDLDRLSGVENLKQALLLRFLTPVGELAQLGHSRYGSRLYELLGERNTEANRDRAKLYVLEALAAEPRVAKVIAVKVTSRRTDPTRIDISVEVEAAKTGDILTLTVPLSLEELAFQGGVS